MEMHIGNEVEGRQRWTLPQLIQLGHAAESNQGSIDANKEVTVTNVNNVVYKFSDQI